MLGEKAKPNRTIEIQTGHEELRGAKAPGVLDPESPGDFSGEN